MKIKTTYIRQIFLTSLLVLSIPYEIYSQGTDMSNVKLQNLYIGISLKPSQSSVINEGMSTLPKLLSSKKNSFSGSLELGYFFSRYLGFSSGIGLNSFSSELTLDTYQSNFSATDSENETYEMRVSVLGIKELQKIDFLSVPICINLRVPFSESIGLFLQTGVNMSLPINKKYTSSGTFTYKGYYPAYNVLLENLPAVGFPTDLMTSAEGDLDLKPFSINAIASAGLDFYLMNNIQIAAGFSYNRSLSGISKYTSPESFQLSSDPEQMNSMMGGASNTVVQSVGLNIVLRYYIK